VLLTHACWQAGCDVIVGCGTAFSAFVFGDDVNVPQSAAVVEAPEDAVTLLVVPDAVLPVTPVDVQGTPLERMLRLTWVLSL
jgi:hypothetical protein